MPGISKILLAKRMHEDHDKLLYPRFSGQTASSENQILIAIPALVYEMDVKGLDDTNNIFVSTVIQLAKIKRQEIPDNGQLYDYLEKRTGLSRALIKAILKEEEINKDTETGIRRETPLHTICRVVYNPISGTFFPDSISDQTFDISTKVSNVRISDDGVELEFRLQDAQKWQSAYILHADSYDEDRTLRNPTELINKVPGLRQRLFNNRAGKNDIYYTGQCQSVSLLCYCYLSDNDLTALHLSNPIGNADMDIMLPSLMEMMQKYSSENEELIGKINELDETRKGKLEKASDWDQQLEAQGKEIRVLYPRLAQNASILSRVRELTQSMHDTDRDKVVIAFHEFLEEILLFSCNRNIPTDEQYDERCKLLQGEGDKVELLVGFAEEAGFIANDDDRRIAARCFALRKNADEKKAKKAAPISDYETDTNITGVKYNNEGANAENRQDIIRDLKLRGLLENGQILKLEADPTNPHDTNAIKVIGPDGRQLGYLPANIAIIVRSRMNNGESYQAIVTKVKGGNGFNYGVDIHIKGETPSINNYREQRNSQHGYIRYKQLEDLLKGKGNSSSNLPEILAANITQAVVSPSHPFRKLSTTCHDIISTVYYSINFRNHAKHEDEKRKTFEAYVSQDRMERTMDSLLDCVMNVQRLSGEALERERNDKAGRQKARLEAGKQAEHYPMLKKFKNGEPLEEVCTDYFFHNSQYFSKCSNLLDKLLIEILSEQTEYAQRQQVSKTFFTGNRLTDAAKMEQIFSEIGCEYRSQDKPNTGKIKANWNVKNLTLKNKLFLCFAILYRYNRPYLDDIVRVAPKIAVLTDQVCILRAHNKTADFGASKDGYKEFHSDLLDCCENLCKLISET